MNPVGSEIMPTLNECEFMTMIIPAMSRDASVRVGSLNRGMKVRSAPEWIIGERDSREKLAVSRRKMLL